MSPSLNASWTITLSFRLIPLGKAWTLSFPLLWVKIVSLLFLNKNRFTIKYPYKFELQFHYCIIFQTNTFAYFCVCIRRNCFLLSNFPGNKIIHCEFIFWKYILTFCKIILCYKMFCLKLLDFVVFWKVEGYRVLKDEIV